MKRALGIIACVLFMFMMGAGALYYAVEARPFDFIRAWMLALGFAILTLLFADERTEGAA